MNKKLNSLEKERLKDWFFDKYDYKVYQEVNAELIRSYNKRFPKVKVFFLLALGIPEKDRIWLIEETKRRLEVLFKQKQKEAER